MSRLITLLISLFVLCSLCLSGTVAAGDPAEAQPQIESVAQPVDARNDQAERCYAEGLRLKELGEFTKSAQLIRQAADNGHLMARYILGTLYQDGAGVAPDEIEAYAWWGLAADAGCQQAKDALAAVQPELDRDSEKMAAVYRRTMELGSFINRR